MHANTALSFDSLVQRFLINRRFALVWFGQAVSRVGDFVFDTTLILWIALQIASGRSWAPLAVSGVMIAIAAPSFLLGPIAGVFVDRWDKRTTTLTMDVLRALLVSTLIPLSLWQASLSPGVRLAWIYVVVALATVCSQFFEPARMALISDVVDEEQQTRASALGQVTLALAGIIGPPIAPVLFVNFGTQWALGINAVSFLISFGAIFLLGAPRGRHEEVDRESGRLWSEFAAGLRFFSGNRVLVTILVVGVIAMLGAGTLNVLDVFFVTGNLHAGASAYGWISGAFAAGSLIGALTLSALSNRLDPARLLWIALLLTGAVVLVYSRLTSVAPAIVLLAAAGVVVSGVDCAIMPLVLRSTPRDYLGRISGVLNPAFSLASIASMALSAILVGTLLHGFHARALGQTFGPVDTLFACTGVIMTASGVYAMIRLPRQRERDGDTAESDRVAAVV